MDLALLKKIRKLEIRTRRLVDSTFSGSYHAAFKGQGINFAEVRPYQHGDDVRLIDWNVTAKTGSPHIKLFDEERELQVILLVDISGSGRFGSQIASRRDMGTEIAAVLGFSAIKNQDRVGLILCTDRVEKNIPPKRGRDHILRLIRDLYCFVPMQQTTKLSVALDCLVQVYKRRAIVFLISDFLDTGFSRSLQIAARKHEIVPIVVSDSRETELPNAGILWLEDPETGIQFPVNSASPDVRKRYQSLAMSLQAERQKNFQKAGVSPVYVDMDRGYLEPLRRYFASRGRHHA